MKMLPEKDIEKKLIKWGIIKKDSSENEIINKSITVNVNNWFIKPEIQLLKDIEINNLKERLSTLENMLGLNTEILKVDIIYEEYKAELEATYYGKIIAIDLESKKILAIEDNILNAYKEAKKQSDKNKFGYKRIGYNSIYRMVWYVLTKNIAYEDKYKICEDSFSRPFIKIILDDNELIGLADTGCDTGLVMSKEEAERYDLGEPITEEPIPITVASGNQFGAEVYIKTVKVGELEKEIEICVIDVEKIIGKDDASIEPCIGRGLLDFFNVLFKGVEKNLCVYCIDK